MIILREEMLPDIIYRLYRLYNIRVAEGWVASQLIGCITYGGRRHKLHRRLMPVNQKPMEFGSGGGLRWPLYWAWCAATSTAKLKQQTRLEADPKGRRRTHSFTACLAARRSPQLSKFVTRTREPERMMRISPRSSTPAGTTPATAGLGGQ